MKEKFTQGDWVASVSRFRASDEHPWVDVCWGVGSGGFSIVGEVNGGATLDMNLGQMSEVCKANAQLIAAAPKMYRLLDALKDFNCPFDYMEADEMIAFSNINKLLAEARGESKDTD